MCWPVDVQDCWSGEDINREKNKVEQDVHGMEFLFTKTIQHLPSGSEVSLELRLEDLSMKTRSIQECHVVLHEVE